MKPLKPEIVLTGDRPTGKLHIGHYVGSIKQRLISQAEYQTNYLIDCRYASFDRQCA